MSALPPIAYRIKDAAERLRVSKVTVFRYIRAGRLPARKISPSVTLILAEDLDAFMGTGGARHNQVVPNPGSNDAAAQPRLSYPKRRPHGQRDTG